MIRLAKELLTKGVKFVNLCEVLMRNTKTYQIHEKIRYYNARLEAMCQAEPNIRFWEHRRLRVSILKSPNTVLRNDGVHLTNKGNYFLYYSLKNAALDAMSHVIDNSPCVHETETEKKRGGTRQRKR